MEREAAALLEQLGPGYKGPYDKLQSEQHRKVWRNTRQNAIKDLVKQNARLREQNERALAEAKGNAAPQACCIPWPFPQPGRARAPPSRIIATRGTPEATHRGPTRVETLRTTLTLRSCAHTCALVPVRRLSPLRTASPASPLPCPTPTKFIGWLFITPLWVGGVLISRHNIYTYHIYTYRG